MARNQGPILNWSQYVAARLAVMGLTMIDAESNVHCAATVGRQIYRFDHRHRQRAAAHIARSFPELSSPQQEKLTLGSFEHFVQLVVEILHLPRLISADSWPNHFRPGRFGEAIRLLNAGRPIIMLTGHLGNWEVLGYLMAVLGYPMDAIARPLDNPLIYQWLLGIRQRHGMRIFTKWDATDRMLQVLNSGGALGFIADQNAGDRGLFVPFFGRLASTYKSIGILAMRKRVPVVCGYAHRVGKRGFEYEMGTTDIIQPDEWENQRDPLYYITARYMRAIETMVRQCPEQYLWMHRRWKSRPRHESLGKPMPKPLRRNLEELPWMEPGTLENLVHPEPEPRDEPPGSNRPVKEGASGRTVSLGPVPGL